MKNKVNILVVALLLCVTALFAGCTKAGNASYIDITSKFNTELSSSVTTKGQTGSAILLKKNNGNYAFQFNPDNIDLNKKVNEVGTKYNKLSNNEIYSKLLAYSSNYFLGKLMNNDYMVAYQDYLAKVPQDKWTNLWNSTDDVINQIKSFGESYRRLSSCYKDANPDATNAISALDKLLGQYKKLIGSVLQQNLDSQEIFDNYLFQDNKVEGQVTQIEQSRIIDSFVLYFTEYIYQRYMAFTSETQITISSELLTKLSTLANTRVSANSSNVDTYNYLLLVEKSMRNKVEQNRNAVEILKGKVPAEADKDFEYKNLVYQDFVGYEQTLISYADALISLING